MDAVELVLLEAVGSDDAYVPFGTDERELRAKATTLVEGGISFDYLDEVPEWRTNRSMVDEAIRVCLALAYLQDEELFRFACQHKGNPRVMHAVWKALHARVDEDGLTPWEQTVFETLKVRTPLYEDDWSEPLVRAYPGFIKLNRKLRFLRDSVDQDRARSLAFAWLEGDERAQPLNQPRTRHRDDGDWILVFDARFFPGIDHRISVITVCVSSQVFVEQALDDGSKVALRRGRMPAWMKKAAKTLTVERIKYQAEVRVI